MEEAQYIKSFNQGYVLAKYAPDLMDSLKPSVDQNNDYLKGMLSGAQQYDRDKAKEINKIKYDKETPAKDQKNQDMDMDREH